MHSRTHNGKRDPIQNPFVQIFSGAQFWVDDVVEDNPENLDDDVHEDQGVEAQTPHQEQGRKQIEQGQDERDRSQTCSSSHNNKLENTMFESKLVIILVPLDRSWIHWKSPTMYKMARVACTVIMNQQTQWIFLSVDDSSGNIILRRI